MKLIITFLNSDMLVPSFSREEPWLGYELVHPHAVLFITHILELRKCGIRPFGSVQWIKISILKLVAGD